MVYIDDDIESESISLLVIHLMKHVMHFVLKQIRIPTDLDRAKITVATRYLGWLICLQRKAVKLPLDKRLRILNRIETFTNGTLNVITGQKKKTKFLYSGREIAAVSGSLLHFSEIHFELKPFLTPFYRLLDGYVLTSRKH